MFAHVPQACMATETSEIGAIHKSSIFFTVSQVVCDDEFIDMQLRREESMEKAARIRMEKTVILPALRYAGGRAIPGWKEWVAPEHKIHWHAPGSSQPVTRGFHPTHIRENTKSMRGMAIAWTYWDGGYWRWPSDEADHSVWQLCWNQNRYWADAVMERKHG